VRELDLVVSVGGDGTFLRAAHLASRGDVPVLGVKVGRMGFLTEVEPDEASAVLARMLADTARIEERLAALAEPDGATFAAMGAERGDRRDFLPPVDPACGVRGRRLRGRSRRW
jgi:NAD+ kinase